MVRPRKTYSSASVVLGLRTDELPSDVVPDGIHQFQDVSEMESKRREDTCVY